MLVLPFFGGGAVTGGSAVGPPPSGAILKAGGPTGGAGAGAIGLGAICWPDSRLLRGFGGLFPVAFAGSSGWFIVCIGESFGAKGGCTANKAGEGLRVRFGVGVVLPIRRSKGQQQTSSSVEERYFDT